MFSNKQMHGFGCHHYEHIEKTYNLELGSSMFSQYKILYSLVDVFLTLTY